MSRRFLGEVRVNYSDEPGYNKRRGRGMGGRVGDQGLWTRGIIAHGGNRSAWTLRSIAVETIRISVQWEENLIICLMELNWMRYRAKPIESRWFQAPPFFRR